MELHITYAALACLGSDPNAELSTNNITIEDCIEDLLYISLLSVFELRRERGIFQG